MHLSLSQSTKKAINRTLDDIRTVVNDVGQKINGVVLLLLKFVGFYIAIHTVTGDMNGLYQGEGFLTKTLIRLALAVVCTILPARFGTLLVLGLMCYFMVKVSLFGGIIASLLVLVIFLITVCFTPEYAYLLLLVPFLAEKGWFMLVPLFVGLYATPMAVLGLIFGGVMWAALKILPSLLSFGATVLDGGSLGDLLEFLPTMVVKTGLEVASSFVENKALIFYGVVIAAAAVIAWIVNKLRIKYAPYWAILSAGMFGMIALIVLRAVFGFPGKSVFIIFGTIGAMLFAALLRLLDVPLDYRFVRNLTFSDDEYYYQVRLTPVAKTYQESRKARLAKKKKKNVEVSAKSESKLTDETKVLSVPVSDNASAEITDGDTIVLTSKEQEKIRSEEKAAKAQKEKKASQKSEKKAEKQPDANNQGEDGEPPKQKSENRATALIDSWAAKLNEMKTSGQAERAAKQSEKAAKQAEKDAAKEAEKAVKAAKKAEEDAAKAAKKAEEDAAKAAKKAEEDAAKAARKAEQEAAKETSKKSSKKTESTEKGSGEGETKEKQSDFWQEVKKAAKRSLNKLAGKKSGKKKKTKGTSAEEKATQAEVDEVLSDL